MPSIPLGTKLAKQSHRTLALAQDVIVLEAVRNMPSGVLHGGTAIWRCYHGNRFSEDTDFYLPIEYRGRTRGFLAALAARGFEKQKFKTTANAMYAKFSYQRTGVSFEAVYRLAEGHIVKPYEMFDGSFMLVNTLGPEALLQEKAEAFLERGKVRDLYDVYYLSSITGPSEGVNRGLRKLLERFRKPVDERALRAVIITGVAPTVEEMLEEIRRRAR